MPGVKPLPILRCRGVPVPFWDSRPVPQATLLEYLGCDRFSSWSNFVQAGLLGDERSTITRGATRPHTSYIPAVIWAHMGWVPSSAALAPLAASDAVLREHIAATERLLGELRALAEGATAKPRAPIPFPTSATAREG